MIFAAGDSGKELKDIGFLLGDKTNPQAGRMSSAGVCF